jgi:hypothetical protein
MTSEPAIEMARKHHYFFAHQFLPGALWASPQQAMDTFSHEEEARAFVRMLWRVFAGMLPPEERLPPGGLDCHTRALEKGRLAVLVEMPPPLRMLEAYFVGFVFIPRKLLFFFPRPPEIRCLTLESGVNLDGSPRTVLGGWRKEEHFNLGDGPPPEREAFFEVLRQAALSV